MSGGGDEVEVEVDSASEYGEGEAEAEGQVGGVRQGLEDHHQYQYKTFVFSERNTASGTPSSPVHVVIPELLVSSYSFYTWPCAPVLARFLYHNREEYLRGKSVLEIGSGTALPGILAAKCGARVTLSDSCTLPKTLAHIARCCAVNGLTPGRDIRIVGLTWGLFLDDVFRIGPFDLLIGSDCFYDPSVFEDVIATVAFFLERKESKFLCAYQERSSDWTVEHLLKKWNLKCDIIDLNSISASTGIDFAELMGGHSIHLLEIAYDR